MAGDTAKAAWSELPDVMRGCKNHLRAAQAKEART